MSKKCPNCGFTESDDANVCHICGKPLVEDNSGSDFDFNFGAEIETSSSATFSNAGQPFGTTDGTGAIPITISDLKANKMRKNLLSLTSSLLVICIMRFVFAFLDLEDFKEMSWYLPLFEGTEFHGVLKSAVDLYYASIVILALIVVAAIVQLVFSYRVNKFTFPARDERIFVESKKTFYCSIATTAVVAIYFIIEISSLITLIRMENMLGEDFTDLAGTVAPLVIDVILVISAVMHLVSSLQLSKCKKPTL